MNTPARPSRLPTARPALPVTGRPPGAPAPVALTVPVVPSVEVPLVDAGPFKPDVQALNKAAEKGQTEKLEEKTRAQVIQAIHSLALLAPGVFEAMGSSESNDDQVERFRAWSIQVRELAQQWVERWPVAPEDREWAVAAL